MLPQVFSFCTRVDVETAKMCFSQEEDFLSNSSDSSTGYDLIRIKTENERFKASLVCKICNSAPIEILTLPCAHTVCCQECVDMNDNCPLCDNRILGYVRVYMC